MKPYLFGLIFMSGILFAQPSEYEDVLIPIHAPVPVPGAYGSQWETDLWLRNSGSADLLYVPCGFCPLPGTGPGLILPPHSAIRIEEGTANSVGALFHLGRYDDDTPVHFSLRLFERSEGVVRQGIEYPVVRERDFLTAPVELLNVPTDLQSRIAVRVYDVRASTGRQVRLEILPLTSDTVLAERVLTFEKDPNVDNPPGPLPRVPTVVQILDLAQDFPAIAAEPYVRIRLTPMTPGLEYWGFANITDRETQYVSLVTPQ